MMHFRTRCSGVVLLSLLTTASLSSAQTQQIPLDEYLAMHDYAAYGYYSEFGNPATPNVIVRFDTVGARVAYYGGDVGTTVTGRVTIRPLPDGRAYVTVLIHTTNAVCWAYDGSAIAFGASPRQVVESGYTPSLGSGTERIEFTMPSVDTPLPPLWELWDPEYPEYQVQSFLAELSCKGALTAASGYPAGTPGMAHVTQRALYRPGVPTGCPDGYCWPVELAFYKPLGK